MRILCQCGISLFFNMISRLLSKNAAQGPEFRTLTVYTIDLSACYTGPPVHHPETRTLSGNRDNQARARRVGCIQATKTTVNR